MVRRSKLRTALFGVVLAAVAVTGCTGTGSEPDGTAPAEVAAGDQSDVLTVDVDFEPIVDPNVLALVALTDIGGQAPEVAFDFMGKPDGIAVVAPKNGLLLRLNMTTAVNDVGGSTFAQYAYVVNVGDRSDLDGIVEDFVAQMSNSDDDRFDAVERETFTGMNWEIKLSRSEEMPALALLNVQSSQDFNGELVVGPVFGETAQILSDSGLDFFVEATATRKQPSSDTVTAMWLGEQVLFETIEKGRVRVAVSAPGYDEIVATFTDLLPDWSASDNGSSTLESTIFENGDGVQSVVVTSKPGESTKIEFWFEDIEDI